MGVTTTGPPAAGQRPGWTAVPTPRAARRRRFAAGLAGLALLTAAAFLLQAFLPGLLASASPASAAPAQPLPSVATTRFSSQGGPVRIPVSAATRIAVTAPPAHGSAAVAGTAVVYTPRPEHIGQDRLTLSACRGQQCTTATVEIRTGRPGLSALTSVATAPVIRRADQPLLPGARISGSVPAGSTAVAVSVTVTRSARAGRVTLDGGAGAVAALRVARAGATTTNLVIVPVSGSSLRVVSEPGGGLTVDVVGTFSAGSTAAGPANAGSAPAGSAPAGSAPADSVRAGRFVPVKQARVVSLTTSTDGRNATVDPARFGAKAGIRAVLAVVTAVTGRNPAWVDLGAEPGQIDRTLSWGPGPGSDERRSLALIPVNRKGQFSLHYEHGSTIDVDVLGYFTGVGAGESVAGLYVPRTPVTVFDGVARPAGTRIAAPAPAAAVFVNLSGAKGVTGRLPAQDVGIASGRTIGTTLTASDGKTVIRASRPLSVRATLLGYFVAGQ